MLYRFYYIRCDETNDIYLGKTRIKLSRRLGIHISLKNCTSKIITQYNSCVIILLEEVECTEEESVAIERAYIETYICVNEKLPGRTPEEWREYYKVEIAEKKKEWYELNKKRILEEKHTYRQLKKIEIATYEKKYRALKHVEISKRRNKKYTCICGKICVHSSKARHERSQFHKNFTLNIGS